MRQLAAVLFLLCSVAVSAAELRGVVVDKDAKPIKNANVYVYAAFPKKGVSTICPNCYRDCGKQQAVNGEGAFRVKDVDPSLRFDVLAVADGYEPAFASKVDPESGEATSIVLTPRSDADKDRLITGIVLDHRGKPVVGAAVQNSGYHMRRVKPNGELAEAVGYGAIPGVDKLSITNAKGEFALRIPEATGKLDVRVTARGLAPHIDRLLVPGETRTIHLVEGANIRGRVERDGKPLPSATVRFAQRNRASSGFLGLYDIGTDDKGEFLITNMGIDTEWVVSVDAAEPKFVKTAGTNTTVDAGTLTVSQ